jgi:hypothetical protein
MLLPHMQSLAVLIVSYANSAKELITSHPAMPFSKDKVKLKNRRLVIEHLCTFQLHDHNTNCSSNLVFLC